MEEFEKKIGILKGDDDDGDSQKPIILQLKEEKESKNLSINEIAEMLEARGEHMHTSTLYKVFEDGSENKSFSYERTLRPIARVLLDSNKNASDQTVKADMDLYLTICRYKMNQIDSLHLQIDKLKEELSAKNEDYNRSVAFLRGRINKLDEKMDRKDETIDKLIELIERLTTCKECPQCKLVKIDCEKEVEVNT